MNCTQTTQLFVILIAINFDRDIYIEGSSACPVSPSGGSACQMDRNQFTAFVVHLVERLHQERSYMKGIASVFESIPSALVLENPLRRVSYFLLNTSDELIEFHVIPDSSLIPRCAIQYPGLSFRVIYAFDYTRDECVEPVQFHYATWNCVTQKMEETQLYQLGDRNSILFGTWAIICVAPPELSFISCTININMSSTRRHHFWFFLSGMTWRSYRAAHFIMIFFKMYIVLLLVYFYIKILRWVLSEESRSKNKWRTWVNIERLFWMPTINRENSSFLPPRF